MDRILTGTAEDRGWASRLVRPSHRHLVMWALLMFGCVNIHLLGQSTAGKADPVVVLELFTSEGCSSCPPAEKLLEHLAKEDVDHVFALAFHVDYWDYLGWKDPFGDPAFTKRQRRYGQALSPGRIYTPQLIVNGRQSVVGSDERAVRRALTTELKRSASAELRFEKVTVNGNELSCQVQTDYDLAGTRVFMAVVEHELDRRIRAGENRGRHFNSSHVVRGLTKAKPDKKGVAALALALPKNLERTRANVIVWLQDQRDGRILGAGRHQL